MTTIESIPEILFDRLFFFYARPSTEECFFFFFPLVWMLLARHIVTCACICSLSPFE